MGRRASTLDTRFSIWDKVLRSNSGLILGRCLGALLVLAFVSLFTFFIVNVLPGNAARQLAGIEATPEQIARLEIALGLDRPPLVRYWDWLTNTLTGDLGVSLASAQPVTALIGERVPVTIQLAVFALVLATTFAVPLALLSARWPHGTWDRVGMAISIAGVSLASYIVAPVLILIFAVHWGVLPAIGFAPFADDTIQNLRSLTLPVIAVAFPLLGLYTRFLRGDLLEQLRHDYILAARTRGLSEWRILVRHALPNSVFGLLNVIALNLGGLIGGAVIVEEIFALPGIGQMLLEAVRLRDVIVVQAIVLMLAVVTVLINLTVDILHAMLDPRIHYDLT